MNGLVAVLADNEGLAVAGGQPLPPEGFLPAPWLVQVREFPDLGPLAGRRGSAKFADCCQQALHDLASLVEHRFGVVVEASVFLPTSLYAPKPRD